MRKGSKASPSSKLNHQPVTQTLQATAAPRVGRPKNPMQKMRERMRTTYGRQSTGYAGYRLGRHGV